MFPIFEVPVPKSVVPNVGTSYVWCVLLLHSYLSWFLSLCYSINGDHRRLPVRTLVSKWRRRMNQKTESSDSFSVSLSILTQVF